MLAGKAEAIGSIRNGGSVVRDLRCQRRISCRRDLRVDRERRRAPGLLRPGCGPPGRRADHRGATGAHQGTASRSKASQRAGVRRRLDLVQGLGARPRRQARPVQPGAAQAELPAARLLHVEREQAALQPRTPVGHPLATRPKSRFAAPTSTSCSSFRRRSRPSCVTPEAPPTCATASAP